VFPQESGDAILETLSKKTRQPVTVKDYLSKPSSDRKKKPVTPTKLPSSENMTPTIPRHHPSYDHDTTHIHHRNHTSPSHQTHSSSQSVKMLPDPIRTIH